MNPNDLTTLAHLKEWLTVPSSNTDSDVLLQRMISAVSNFFQTVINRQFVFKTYNERRDGSGVSTGRYSLRFNNYPVSAVYALSVNGVAVPASADSGVLQPGYGFDSKLLWVAQASSAGGTGYALVKGRRNIVVSYGAGFLVLPYGTAVSDDPTLLPTEVQTIPATPYKVTTLHTWLLDNGVAFNSTGIALVRVSASPAAGQYSVADGVYTFAAADTGKDVALSYSYVPYDVEQGCLEVIGVRFKEKDRIGVVSKVIGTESVSFTQKDLPDDVKLMLNQYAKRYAF